MKKINKNFWLILFISALVLAIFYNFFFKNLFPYPGNYMIAWYEPWKSDHIVNQTITIIHKAVADDTFRQFFPFRLLAADFLKQFEFPLWNPYNGSGMPLLATMHFGLLNPFILFFIFLPPPFAWSFHIITQFILLCIFTYLYCRSIKIGFLASLFTLTTLSLSGFVIDRLIFGDYIYTLAFLPFILYIVEKFSQNPKTKLLFLTTPGIAFILFSGAPQIILYILTIIVCYAIYRIKNIKQLLLFLIQYVIGIGLAAIQLLPTFELYKNAAITTDSSKFIFDRFLLPLQHLITIIIPNYFGNQATYNYWGSGDYIETIAAIGSIPCFFMILSLWTKNKEHKTIKNFYVITLLITIISTLDFFATRAFFSLQVPILSTGIPSRIFILTSFAIAILAGLGFEKLVTDKVSIRDLFYKTSPYLIVLVTIFAATAILAFTHSSCPNNSTNIPCRTVALRNTIIEIIIFLIFTITLIISWLKKRNFSKFSQLFTILLIVIIGIYNANKFLPFSNAETFNPQNDLITILQTKTQDGRVFGFDDANIKTDFATQFKFYDPNYYDPLYNKRYGELAAFATNKKLLRSDVDIDYSATPSANIKIKRDKLLNLLAVKYFIFKKTQVPLINNDIIWEDKIWYIKKNDHALSHVFLTDNYEIISDDKKILNTLFSKTFDPKTKVITEKQIDFKPNYNVSGPNNVDITSYQENKLSIKSFTSSDKILVLLDNYYPGWKAYIDEKPTDIFRVDYTFRGIVLPKGSHTIKFEYQPDSIKTGFFVSTIAIILYLLYIFILHRTKLLDKINQ